MPDAAAIVRVADAVTAAISGNDFGVEFETERSYADWKQALEELDCLRVDVVPVIHNEADVSTRDNRVDYTCQVDVAIRKRFNQSDQNAVDGRVANSEIDRLVLLVEQIFEFLTHPDRRRLSDSITWESAKVLWTCNRKDLRDNRQFTGLVRYTYDVHKVT